MLPKRRRLTAVQLREVLTRGKRTCGSNLSVKYMAQPGPFCVVVVASKAIAKQATQRNRLRRAVYRALAAAQLPQSGHAVVFVDKVPLHGDKALTPAFTAELAQILPSRVQ